MLQVGNHQEITTVGGQKRQRERGTERTQVMHWTHPRNCHPHFSQFIFNKLWNITRRHEQLRRVQWLQCPNHTTKHGSRLFGCSVAHSTRKPNNCWRYKCQSRFITAWHHFTSEEDQDAQYIKLLLLGHGSLMDNTKLEQCSPIRKSELFTQALPEN